MRSTECVPGAWGLENWSAQSGDQGLTCSQAAQGGLRALVVTSVAGDGWFGGGRGGEESIFSLFLGGGERKKFISSHNCQGTLHHRGRFQEP